MLAYPQQLILIASFRFKDAYDAEVQAWVDDAAKGESMVQMLGMAILLLSLLTLL